MRRPAVGHKRRYFHSQNAQPSQLPPAGNQIVNGVYECVCIPSQALISPIRSQRRSGKVMTTTFEVLRRCGLGRANPAHRDETMITGQSP